MKLVKIGRSKECDIIFENDTNISRIHAEIFLDDEGNIFLTDLNSSNGTFVNGKKINDSVIIKKNDIIKLGKTVIPWKNYVFEDKTHDKKIVKAEDSNENNVNADIDEIMKSEPRNKKSIYYYLISILITCIFVNTFYEVSNLWLILDVLGALFIPSLTAFALSLYSKIKFEITFIISTFLIITAQLILV